LPRLRTIGLVIDIEGGQWNWRPASRELDDLCRRVAQEYAQRPVGIANLVASRRGHVRLLADAFRFWRK